jgi:hypothetical protein
MPTAVESIASLGAVVVQLSSSSSHIITGDNWLQGAMAPSTQSLGTRDMASGLPTGQRMHKPCATMAPSDLRPDVQKISAALKKTLPANQKMIDALGVGTDMPTLHALIELLKTEGYYANVAYFDSSALHGFPKPVAVLRSHGGSVPTVFLHQVAAAMQRVVQDDWL